MTYVIVFWLGMLAGIAAVWWAIVVEARTVRRPGSVDLRRPW